jgi:hypothetical protein
MNTANTIAKEFNNNGQIFDGLEDSMSAAGGKCQYGKRIPRDDQNDPQRYEAGSRGDHFSGDPIRYEFADGSAIVICGDGWDIEGAELFSWVNE